MFLYILYVFCRDADLFFGSELVKHLLNLQLPVILQGLEGFCWHFKESRLLNSCQLVQNTGERGSCMRVHIPAVYSR